MRVAIIAARRQPNESARANKYKQIIRIGIACLFPFLMNQTKSLHLFIRLGAYKNRHRFRCLYRCKFVGYPTDRELARGFGSWRWQNRWCRLRKIGRKQILTWQWNAHSQQGRRRLTAWPSQALRIVPNCIQSQLDQIITCVFAPFKFVTQFL